MVFVPLAATVLALIYWYLAINQRVDDTAKSWDAKNPSHDQGTTRLMWLIIFLQLFTPWGYMFLLGSGKGSYFVDLILLLLIPTGIYLRSVAMRTLGKFFTRTLQIREGHKVVSTGPYAWIRHPGYAAHMLVNFPYALLITHSVGGLAIQIAIFAAGYTKRIGAEEKMLRESLGDEYRAYEKKVPSRLIPFVF
eukprot:m.228483 g.228483  ORF g.228483 m.228483 type:complete len:193 (-) comp17489_c0_seq1:27-605(-)